MGSDDAARPRRGTWRVHQRRAAPYLAALLTCGALLATGRLALAPPAGDAAAAAASLPRRAGGDGGDAKVNEIPKEILAHVHEKLEEKDALEGKGSVFAGLAHKDAATGAPVDLGAVTDNKVALVVNVASA